MHLIRLNPKSKQLAQSVSFSCNDPAKFTESVRFPSALCQLSVLPIFAYPFRGH